MAPDQRTVADVMVTRPRAFGPATSVAQLRQFFADDHVHAAPIVDHDLLIAVVVRDDLGGSDAVLATQIGTLKGRTIPPDADAETTRLAMLDRGIRRLAVVDEGHRLLGLLCLKRSGRGFCSDADVAARAAERDHECGEGLAGQAVHISPR